MITEKLLLHYSRALLAERSHLYIRSKIILTLFAITFSVAGFGHQYTRTDLTADVASTAANKDPNLVNAWGLSRSSTGPWWISDNGTGLSTLYDLNGVPQPLVVTIPPPGSVSRVEEPRKISEKIWRRITLCPAQQKRACYGPLFCPKQTLFKSPDHLSSITLPAGLQLCLVLHAVSLG